MVNDISACFDRFCVMYCLYPLFSLWFHCSLVSAIFSSSCESAWPCRSYKNTVQQFQLSCADSEKKLDGILCSFLVAVFSRVGLRDDIYSIEVGGMWFEVCGFGLNLTISGLGLV